MTPSSIISPARVARTKVADLLVTRVEPSHANAVTVWFDNDTWMTVWDEDLPRRPRPGDVLRVRIPRAEAILNLETGA